MLYNFPLNTGVNLEAETVARIAQHPNVCGIKDSSGNIPQCAQIIHQTPKTFHVHVGSASALLPALTIGAAGAIVALGTISAREWCDVYALAKAGRWDEAREIAARMMSADRGVPGRYGIGGLKAALDLQGFYGGLFRLPPTTPHGGAFQCSKKGFLAPRPVLVEGGGNTGGS